LRGIEGRSGGRLVHISIKESMIRPSVDNRMGT
jgi:hypothetical protein